MWLLFCSLSRGQKPSSLSLFNTKQTKCETCVWLEEIKQPEEIVALVPPSPNISGQQRTTNVVITDHRNRNNRSRRIMKNERLPTLSQGQRSGPRVHLKPTGSGEWVTGFWGTRSWWRSLQTSTSILVPRGKRFWRKPRHHQTYVLVQVPSGPSTGRWRRGNGW